MIFYKTFIALNSVIYCSPFAVYRHDLNTGIIVLASPAGGSESLVLCREKNFDSTKYWFATEWISEKEICLIEGKIIQEFCSNEEEGK